MAIGLAKIELEGFEELTATFNGLEQKLRKKALRPALRAGAKVILVRAKQNAPSDSGRMRKYMKVVALKRSRTEIGVQVVNGTRDQLQIPKTKKAGYYPTVVEFGAHKRNIKGSRSFTRAFLSEKQKAIRAIAQRMKQEIEKIFKK